MIIIAFILFYLIGNGCFHCFADFNTSYWCNAYYLWQVIAHGGVFAWASLYSMLDKERRKIVEPVLYYSIAMAIWEVVYHYTGFAINDELPVMVAFLLLTASVGTISFYALWKIEKHIP